MRHRALSVLSLLVVTSLVLPVPALASPQPTPVCGFCGGQFAETAGMNVTVAESTVLVRVHENGSATWTVRNRLSAGTEAFRERPGLLDATAARLADDHYGLPDRATFVSARLEGETVVLVYRDPDAATRRAGLLVVDYLHDGGYERWYHVNAERFTLRGPEGTVVTNTPDSGTVDERTATWAGSTGGGYYGSGADLEGSPYVVFGPDRSVPTTLRTAAALGLATLPVVVRSLGQYALFQTTVFAAVLGTVLLVLRRWSPEPDPGRLGAAVAGLGLLGVVGPVVGQGFRLDPVTGPPVFVLLLGSLAWSGRFRDGTRTVRSQALLALGLLAATCAVLVPVYALGTGFDRPIRLAAKATGSAVPLAVMLPLGAALAEGGRALRWWLLCIVGFVVLVVSVVNPTDPPTGLAGGITTFFLLGAAALGPVLGAPVVALGSRLAAERRDTDGDGRTTSASTA